MIVPHDNSGAWFDHHEIHNPQMTSSTYPHHFAAFPHLLPLLSVSPCKQDISNIPREILLLLQRPAIRQLYLIQKILRVKNFVLLQKLSIVNEHSHLPERQFAEFLEHLELTVGHFGVFIAADIDRAGAVELRQVEIEMANGFKTLEEGFVDAVGPGVNGAAVGDADVEVQASDGEVLFVEEAGADEALEDVVAGNAEGVVGVVDLVGFQVDLAAGAE